MLSILKNCSKLTFNSHLLKHSHKFCNSSKNDFEKARLDLSKVVDHQLTQQMKNIPNPKAFQIFFQKDGWKIVRHNAELQLKRSSEEHQFLMLMTIKPPMEMEQNAKQQHMESRKFQLQQLKASLANNKQYKKQLKQISQINVEEQFEQAFTQLAIFIRKIQKTQDEQSNKYMCIEYIGNSKIVQLQHIHFMKNLTKNRITRLQSQQDYPGRCLGFIDGQKLQTFGMNLTINWNITDQHYKNAIQLCWAYQHQQYLNWMGNIKQML